MRSLKATPNRTFPMIAVRVVGRAPIVSLTLTVAKTTEARVVGGVLVSFLIRRTRPWTTWTRSRPLTKNNVSFVDEKKGSDAS